MLLPLGAFAQMRLQVTPVDTTAAFFEKYELAIEYEDFTQVVEALSEVLEELKKENYLLASLDKLEVKDSTAFAEIFVGSRFEWAYLKPGNVESAYLAKAGFRAKSFRRKAFNPLKISKLQESLLQSYENNGYPFAQIKLDSVRIRKGRVDAVLNAQKGTLIYFNQPEIEGDVEISARYLNNYLGISENQPYDRSKVLKIRNRLRELPFLSENEPVKIDFKFDRAAIKLNLKSEKASRFDFVIGVLPNNDEFNRLLITGNFLGEFQNQFGKGERIFAEFEQLRPQTQEINLAFNYPFLFDTPIGADFKFGLYKRDTNFLDVNFDIGAQWLLEAGNYFKGFFNQTNSRLLSIDQSQVAQSRRLPSRLDVSRSTLGVEYLIQKLDYRFNPRKGWESKLRIGAGLKTIEPNSQILDLSNDDFDFKSLYDSLQLQSFQGRLSANAATYLPTASNQTVKLSLNAVYIISEAPVLKNEQYRIGGNRLLRGFDEESIFATNYAIATAEYRLLTGQNSFLFSFFDIAWVEDKTTETNFSDLPFGFGAGVTFDTSAGVFGISYALGSQRGNPIDFGSGKIHFGYLSLF